MRVVLGNSKHVNDAAKLLYSEYYEDFSDAKKYVKSKTKSKCCIVCVDKKEVVGVLLYSKDFSHYTNYIDDIVVAKAFRGQGVGRLLAQKYIQRSIKETPKKQKYALSSTHVGNNASIVFHKKCGFVELGRIRKLHYGKDEIIFGYKLW